MKIDGEQKAFLQNMSEDANYAKQILQNPLFQRIYEEDMDMLFKGFLTVDPSDTERLREINLAGKAMLKIKEKFENIAFAGASAQEALDEQPTSA